MAGASERDNRTEEPTEKRRSDTLEREGGPVSREVGSAAALLVIAVFLAAAAPRLFTGLAHYLAVYIGDPGAWRLDTGEDALLLLQLAGSMAFHFAGLFIAAIILAGLAAGFLQNTPRLLFNRIMPDLSRISLSAGFGRLLSSQALIEFLKGAIKIAVIGFAVIAAIGGLGTWLVPLHSTPDAVPELIRQLCVRITFFCALMTCAIDVFLMRSAWRRNLMMTKQEVKEELKETEGDPALKARLRSAARARIRRRMTMNVPKATLVVTNPTHYAVALRYVRNESDAPKVLAKGQDKNALRIKEIAESHNIPVVENKPLARSLFDSAEVGELIPAEFYKAVAEIIVYLESKSRQPKRKKDNQPFNKPGPKR